jgi:7,8-dihydroneopterin aldolase/epimerase/oxygenase
VDKLFLRELKVETIIGFLEWERRIKQTISIDLEIGADSRAAAAVDAEAGALNYESVARRLVEYVGTAEHKLVETLAEAIAKIVIREFAAPWVKVTVAKPGAVRGARDVGIVVERTAADYG